MPPSHTARHLLVHLSQVAPESAIKFAAFEMLKPILCRYFASSLPKQGEAPRISTAGRVVSGGLAGMIAQTAIYPLVGRGSSSWEDVFQLLLVAIGSCARLFYGQTARTSSSRSFYMTTSTFDSEKRALRAARTTHYATHRWCTTCFV